MAVATPAIEPVPIVAARAVGERLKLGDAAAAAFSFPAQQTAHRAAPPGLQAEKLEKTGSDGIISARQQKKTQQPRIPKQVSKLTQ